MKKFIAACLCLALAFVCGCQPAPTTTSEPLFSSHSAVSPSSASPAGTLPSMPDIEPYVDFEIPTVPSYDYDTWPSIPLEYTIIAPTQDFTSALAALTSDERTAIWETDNYFSIDSYVLFHASNQPGGVSQLAVDNQNGNVQVIFESTQPIWSVGITEKSTLIVELLAEPSPIGAGTKYYELDLQNETLTPLSYPENGSAYGYYCTLYCEVYFLATINPEATDDSLQIFRIGPTGERSLLADNVAYHTFMGGYIYYMLQEKTNLYRMKLDGSEKTLVHTFDTPVHIYMAGGIEAFGKYPYQVLSGNNSGSYVFDIDTKESFPAPQYDILCRVQNGYYTKDAASNTLCFTPFGGAAEPVLGNYKYDDASVIDSWVYFTSSAPGTTDAGNHATLYWKVMLDGTGLSLLLPQRLS